MKNSCVSEAFSLGKPENYIFTMHIMTCFEVPINLYGAYCILFETPKRMASVKFPMLLLHFICFFEDVWISFFCVPYIYFPTLSGLPLGFLCSPRIQVIILCIVLGGWLKDPNAESLEFSFQKPLPLFS